MEPARWAELCSEQRYSFIKIQPLPRRTPERRSSPPSSTARILRFSHSLASHRDWKVETGIASPRAIHDHREQEERGLEINPRLIPADHHELYRRSSIKFPPRDHRPAVVNNRATLHHPHPSSSN